MKCETCSDGRAEAILSWVNSRSATVAAVCDCCAAGIWSTISSRFTGTSAYQSFTVEPYSNMAYKRIKSQVEKEAA